MLGSVLAFALLLSSCSSRNSLPALMVKRLAWMDEVAMAKQLQKLPITDPKRETELLNAMTQRGVAAGLQETQVRGFFTGQMLAAKVVQEEWLRKHPQGVASSVKVPSLTQTVRPALDEISTKMIAQLAKPRTAEGKAAVVRKAKRGLTKAGYSEAVKQAALKGLREGLQE
ncbi:gamma subclass chorismate mutase AroQ [Prosthecobacter sp.]|uniref:gamma subclass chorismate mutase AroQ n=1 Tax=Prosthecobacter sp. TaxID=1965333 RepID=UPI00378352F6